MRQRLERLLQEVQQLAGEQFAGIGVIVTNTPDALPIVPLRNGAPRQARTLARTLAMISAPDDPFHDGFHVLSADLQLLRAAQYFSPPIVAQTRIDRERLVGGRHVAALFGSALPLVLMTGVASRELGVSVFEAGVDVTDRV